MGECVWCVGECVCIVCGRVCVGCVYSNQAQVNIVVVLLQWQHPHVVRKLGGGKAGDGEDH